MLNYLASDPFPNKIHRVDANFEGSNASQRQRINFIHARATRVSLETIFILFLQQTAPSRYCVICIARIIVITIIVVIIYE